MYFIPIKKKKTERKQKRHPSSANHPHFNCRRVKETSSQAKKADEFEGSRAQRGSKYMDLVLSSLLLVLSSFQVRFSAQSVRFTSCVWMEEDFSSERRGSNLGAVCWAYTQ